MPDFADPQEPHDQHLRRAQTGNVLEVSIVADSGPRTGERWTVTGPVFVIGTAADCDLRMENSCLAKYHAYIFMRDQMVTLRQLGPAPVVTVNGRLMRWGELQNGDLLMLGSTRVRVELQRGNRSENGGLPTEDWIQGTFSGTNRFTYPA